MTARRTLNVTHEASETHTEEATSESQRTKEGRFPHLHLNLIYTRPPDCCLLFPIQPFVGK